MLRWATFFKALPVSGPVRNLADSGVTSTKITWTWDAPNTLDDPTDYEYRTRRGNGAWSGWTVTSTRSVSLTGLTPGSSYTIEVRGFTNLGVGVAVSDTASTGGTPRP